MGKDKILTEITFESGSSLPPWRIWAGEEVGSWGEMGWGRIFYQGVGPNIPRR